MDQKEIIFIIGELYIRNYLLNKQIESKEEENKDLRSIILSLQNNATIST